MSSLITAQVIVHIAEQLVFVAGVLIIVTGLIGNTLNILVFTSLKPFRINQCAFYLIVESVANTSQFLLALIQVILNSVFAMDMTKNSLVWCKLSKTLVQAFNLCSLVTVCFAAFDQYLSTNYRFNLRQRSTLRLARCLTFANICFVLLESIPFLLFLDILPIVGCTSSNSIFTSYITFFYYPILIGLLPVLVAVSFSFLAFRNVRRIVRRQMPILRRRLDRQLTAMVLARVTCLTVLDLPLVIYEIYALNSDTNINDFVALAVSGLLQAIVLSLFYLNYAISFYAFFISSSRYRRQVKQVLVKKCWRSCKRLCYVEFRNVNENRVAPAISPPGVSTIELEESSTYVEHWPT